jgi:transketolase
MKTVKELQDFATQVRRDIIRMIHNANSGHPGGALGATDYLTVLYNNFMEYDASNFDMDGKDEDLFFLSNGHLSALWYSVLARVGYFDIKELATFRKINSRLQGHPTTEEGLPGIRVASGSLGQGLSAAVGAALTKKLDGDGKTVYVLMGDGELQEGNIWEAAMFAAHHKVDNLIAAVDYNGQQIDGPVETVINLGNLKAKWEAFGWDVVDCKDGNDIETVIYTLNEAKRRLHKGKPVLILLKTVMGKGVDFMENDYKWHGKAPNDDETQKALSQLPETLGDF